jgi:hypothetical protein
MSITIADDQLAAKLAGADAPVEVRAPDGRVLGLFTPLTRGPEPNLSEEELRQLEDPATGKWSTAAEVEAKLRELRCSR